jgi:hypothetical protein
MMTKKVVMLLTAAIFVFAFAMSAQCASEWPLADETGEYPYTEKDPGKTEIPDNLYELQNIADPTCDGTPADRVECPGPDTQDKDKCTAPFDYDGPFAGGNLFPTDFGSYCPVDQGKGAAATRNRRILMDICECPHNCNLDVGTDIGIQISILTPGVYWAKDDKGPGGKSSSWDEANGWNTVWFDIVGKPVNAACAENFEKRRSFGKILYYRGITTAYNSKGKIQRATTGAPIGDLTQANGDELGYINCPIPNPDYVQVIESTIETDYTITTGDTSEGECLFWIDLPAMRVNKNPQAGVVATSGEDIQVRVTLLWDREYDGVCPACNPPNMCEVVRTVGIVCCEEVKDEDSGCLFFPYVFQGMNNGDDQSWMSGFAISALNRGPDNPMPADAWCKLTVQDTGGRTATYTKDAGLSYVWRFTLDQYIDDFTVLEGGELPGGAVSLKIESNYLMDGYTLMMGEIGGSYFSGGAMARGCDGCCP